MVIRLNRLISFAFICALVGISFLFAKNYEGRDSTVFSENFRRVPVIMYHHVTTDEDKASSYTVTTKELESDMKYITSCGYTAVSVSELIDYVHCGAPLPEKSIVITFDDGFESYQALAVPILARYNIKSSVYIIGSAADLYTRVSDHNISYSNLNWQAVSELQQSPLTEVGSHTYDLHHNEKGERKGMSRLTGESISDYEGAVYDDLMKLQSIFESRNLKVPTAVAYPYGAYDEHSVGIVKKAGFKVSFTCENRINTLTPGEPDCLYNLGRYNRESGIESKAFFKDILT